MVYAKIPVGLLGLLVITLASPAYGNEDDFVEDDTFEEESVEDRSPASAAEDPLAEFKFNDQFSENLSASEGTAADPRVESEMNEAARAEQSSGMDFVSEPVSPYNPPRVSAAQERSAREAHAKEQAKIRQVLKQVKARDAQKTARLAKAKKNSPKIVKTQLKAKTKKPIQTVKAKKKLPARVGKSSVKPRKTARAGTVRRAS